MPIPLFPAISEEVLDVLKQLYPPGTFYDWESRYGDPYKFLLGLSDLFLARSYATVARLWREINPRTVEDKAPDWESFLGLATTFAAQRGTLAQRQNGILAKLRESGAFTIWNAASILALALGYDDTVLPMVYETDRPALRALHSYWQWSLDDDDVWTAARCTKPTDGSNTWSDVLGGKNNWADRTWPADGGSVTTAGVWVDVRIASSGSASTPIDFRLSSANGTSKTWTLTLTSTGRQNFRLRAPTEFRGLPASGRWKLEIRDAVTDTREVTIYAAQLFVEGMAGGLGDASVEWGAYADPDFMGGSGIPAQPDLAEAVVKRIQHSHAIGALLYGAPALLDDDAIPDACVPS